MKLQFLIPLLLTTLLPGTALAQSEPADEALPQYDVELVFHLVAPEQGPNLPEPEPSADTAEAVLRFEVRSHDSFLVLHY